MRRRALEKTDRIMDSAARLERARGHTFDDMDKMWLGWQLFASDSMTLILRLSRECCFRDEQTFER